MLGLSSISEQAISTIDNYIDIAYVSSTGGFYPEKKFNPYAKSKDYSNKDKIVIPIGQTVIAKKPNKVIKMKLSDLINGNIK